MTTLKTLGSSLRHAACLLALALTWTATHAAPLDDVRRLVESSQFDQAYQIALRNPQLIGDVHFDFVYGLAAIGSGHVPEGVLALERHLAAVPANDRARLELARGYFVLGEYARARSEFEFVLRYDPPLGVRENIARFMQAMELRDSDLARSSSRLYAEVGGGHDSNVNGGTFHPSFQLADSLQPLQPGSLGVSDNFMQVTAGGQKTLRVSNRLSVFAGFDLDHKQNTHQRDYDLSSANLTVGFSQIDGRWLYRGTVAYTTQLVGENRNRETIAVNGEANLNVDSVTSLTLLGQYAEYRHPAADAVRDARATTLGAMVTRSFADLWGAPSAGLRFSWTQEDNLAVRPDLGRRLPMLRLFGALSPAENWRVASGLTLLRQNYGGEDIAFGNTRSDTTTIFDLSATYALAPRWTLRGEFVAYQNRSNQELYEYKRQSIAFKSRYQY
jgi:hypothetical protein